ncbi:MAG: thioredoxin family protein [Rhizobiales bacterium]|nr:thioredoxin family protein [Hyphomicrobiales bacterium]
MTIKQRKIEIFSAGCQLCETAVEQIKAAACPSCDVQILDMNQSEVASRAQHLGINSVPAVVIDGVLADCCSSKGINLDALTAAGLGQPLA